METSERRHFTNYWKRSGYLNLATGEPLKTTDKLWEPGCWFHSERAVKRLRKGDHLWILNVYNGRLRLVSHIIVKRHAIGHLTKLPGVLPEEPECEPFEHDITDLVGTLRFEGPRPTVTVKEDGSFDAQHFRSLRRLTPESMSLLRSELQKVRPQYSATVGW